MDIPLQTYTFGETYAATRARAAYLTLPGILEPEHTTISIGDYKLFVYMKSPEKTDVKVNSIMLIFPALIIFPISR